MRSKLKIPEYGWVLDRTKWGFHCHCSVIYLLYDDEIQRIKNRQFVFGNVANSGLLIMLTLPTFQRNIAVKKVLYAAELV